MRVKTIILPSLLGLALMPTMGLALTVGVKEVVASAMYCCLSCGPPERMVFQG